MRSHLVALAAATTLLAASLAAVATPASAATCTAPQVLRTEVTPHNVVVGTTKVKGFDVYTDVQRNGCALSSVKLTLRSPKHTAKDLPMKVLASSDGVTTYVYGIDLSASDLENAEAGRWTATTVTRWSGGTLTSDDAFRVFRAAKITGNATPEPVAAGKKLVVAGHLTRADWQKRSYVGYTKHTVQLQFRPTEGTYATIGSTKSGSKGVLKKTVTAKVDGCYRFVFGGTSTTRQVTSVPDCVDVR